MTDKKYKDEKSLPKEQTNNRYQSDSARINDGVLSYLTKENKSTQLDYGQKF